uniref:dTDP-4-amino-4,6-dideoxygalactose transaminase n=1 Tax=Candidatus Kentrum sp. DK TaxID=2126562 RepID=A0A450SDE7_9GAMM|nr:MAG: dTDP-4-amino-4,6-dideoxygalactose transaminase [Candidatus Kentron sp. DK]
MIKFTKNVSVSSPIPQDSIDRVVRLIEAGKLFRYDFDLDPNESDPSTVMENELAAEVANLEREFSDYTGHRYTVAVNSCGSALFLGLKAAGVQYGDKVFTNALTFTAVPSSIIHAGAVPVYLECNGDYQTDLEDLEKKINDYPDVKFFMLSHMRGHISEMDAIRELCDREGIFLIEDCAHSLGTQWYDKSRKEYIHIGQHGKVSCFSSQSHKMLNSGEGGFLCTNDDHIAAYCILAAGSYEGLYEKHACKPLDKNLFEDIKLSVPNFSLRMSNLTAAVLRPQLANIEGTIAGYKKWFLKFRQVLSSASELIYLPEPPELVSRAADSMQFNLLEFSNEQVDEFVRRTAERGIKIQIFGRRDNARYFRNWKYSFEQSPRLGKTEKIVSCTCDMRLSLHFDESDINLLGYIIKDVAYGLLREEKEEREKQPDGAFRDHKNGVADAFGDSGGPIAARHEAWTRYDDEAYQENGRKILANYLAYQLTTYLNSSDRILDVGCGTGLTGMELASYGFTEIHGVDSSEASREAAQKRNVYREVRLAEWDSPLDMETESFDAWVFAGVLPPDQPPFGAFDALIRILKPQGLLAMAMRVEEEDFHYDKIKALYEKNRLKEVFREKIGVLDSANHEIIIARKIRSLF